MSYQALARKYRPQTFEDILGQESIVQTLRNSIEKERIHQAYLLSGVRGVGKTTTARILAKALNCEKGPTTTPCNECTICREITEGIDLDVREIDAATYTQVDNIRELREVTQFQPARDRNRVFIIDEAHMLSTGAWNALLKLIEEPPPHVVFILATTEIQKVPQTILSRVQKFTFNRITEQHLVDRLRDIVRNEQIEADDDALALLARRGDGSVRDAISLLDQTIAFAGRSIDVESVSLALGLADEKFFERLLQAVDEGATAEIVGLMDEAAAGGRDFKVLYRDFLGYLRSLLLSKSGSGPSVAMADRFEESEIIRMLSVLIRDDELVSRSEQQRLVVEISLLRAAMLPRLRAVESALAEGAGPTPAPGSGRSDEHSTRAPATEPEPGPRPSSAGGGEVRTIVSRFSEARKLAGNYLRMAKSQLVEGDTIRFVFDHENGIARDAIEQEASRVELERIASEVMGRPMQVTTELEEAPETKPTPEQTALENDPVLREFARHLGGEVVRD